MAQAGFTPIQLYRTTTASAVPTAGNLAAGELAINLTDKKLYAKDASNNVFLLADASSGGTTATNLAGGAAGSLPYQTGANATTFRAIGTAGQVLQVNSGATAPEWVNSSGTGDVARTTSPTFTTPILGTPTSVTLTNATGLPLTTGVTGTLPAANGGTGQASYTTGDLLYATGSTALSKLGIGTNGQILTSTGTAPQWDTLSGVAVTTFSAGTTGFTPNSATSGAVTLAGTLATTNGGTGLTSFTANGVVYASSTSALATGSALTFDGTNFGVGGTAATTPTLNKGIYLQSNVNNDVVGYSLYVNEGSNFRRGSMYLDDAAGVWGWDITASSGVPDYVWKIATFEQMRLTSTGLGIGTISPATKLHVDTGAAGYGLTLAASSLTARRFQFGLDSNANLAVYDTAAAAVRMTLDGSGNLGIGTSSPTQKLDVAGRGVFTVADATYATAFNATNGNLRISPYVDANFGTNLTAYNAGYAGYGPLSFDASRLLFYTGGTERMRLDSSGNLGIGTSSPAYKLDVRTTSDGNVGYFRRVGGTINPGITVFANETGNTVGFDTVYSTSSPSYKFRVNGSDVMTLDASGNLGLGVTPSAWWSGSKAIQIGLGATFEGRTGTSIATVSSNSFINSSGVETYINTAAATKYNQGVSGDHRFYTAPSGTAGNAISFTQAMTLDAGGRLLIGMTGLGSGDGDTPLQIDGNSTNSTIYVARFSNSSTSTSVYNVARWMQGASGSAIGMIGTGGSAVGNPAFQNTFVVGTQSSNALVFNTNDTERARITSGGDFGIGNTNPQYRLTVDKDTTSALAFFTNSNASAPNGAYIDFSAASPNNATQYFMYCEDSTAQRATIFSNGGLANYQGNDTNLSDRREKTNFAPAKSYLDTICAIPVQTFNYIDQNLEEDPGLTLGVVAQDVQAVAPELVMESNWGTEDNPKMRLSIYQTDMQYALMKCIQELKAQNDDLRARVAALESQP